MSEELKEVFGRPDATIVLITNGEENKGFVYLCPDSEGVEYMDHVVPLREGQYLIGLSIEDKRYILCKMINDCPECSGTHASIPEVCDGDAKARKILTALENNSSGYSLQEGVVSFKVK